MNDFKRFMNDDQPFMHKLKKMSFFRGTFRVNINKKTVMKLVKHFLSLVFTISLLSCEEDPKPEIITLDGRWETEYGNILEIEGTSSSWIDLTIGDKYLHAAIEQGFVEETDPVIMNIVKTGDLSWTADRFVFAYNEAQNGEVTVVHGEYVEASLSLSQDGNTLTITGTAPNTFPEGFAGENFTFKLTR